MNLRIITKNHVAVSKIGSPLKSIFEPIALTSPYRQPRSKTRKGSSISYLLASKFFPLTLTGCQMLAD